MVVREVGTDKEAVEEVRRISEETGKKVSVLMFSGHGSRYSLDLDSGKSGEETELSLLEDILSNNSKIILNSCLNGKGDNNFAEFVSSVFPCSEVYAGNDSIRGPDSEYRFDEKGNVFVKFYASPSLEERDKGEKGKDITICFKNRVSPWGNPDNLNEEERNIYNGVLDGTYVPSSEDEFSAN